MFLISDLCNLLQTYLTKEQVKDVYQAYLFGAEAHLGQTRMTGEPYIYHPIAVARILAEMRMDSKTLVAAILHDVIEDTPTVKEQLAEEFGQDVADIVDGLTKLDHIHFDNKAEAKAESFRKMILAMVKDIRVIIIKLADRLHNMRTLGIMPPGKARRIAAETLDVYAPIANRLGMSSLRHELENLGFKAYHPNRYKILTKTVANARGNRKEIVNKIRRALKKRLQQEGLDCEVLGREKNIYSIYQKMRDKQLSFSEVFDVYAFRIIVNNVDSCYRVLGMVHGLYKPVPGKFKDYIAIPKVNGYQSLHTILFSPFGVPIEVQIRTVDMHQVAENGIAAHWGYKEEKNGGIIAQAKAREWLKNLLDLQQNAGDSIEFLENVKIDLFPDEVYVFTPKGEIMDLPKGATVVDFAYAVHTDIGNSCISATIDRVHMPLSSRLRNGQTVRIITAPGATPNPSWLNFVITAKARSNIRNYMKHLQRHESIALGRRLMNKCLAAMNMSLDKVAPGRINRLLEELKLNTLEQLLEEIGLGNRVPQLVIRQLLPEHCTTLETNLGDDGGRGLDIKGTEGVVVNYARCCNPIPGDEIVGFISSGRGIVIHTKSCRNAVDARRNSQKWVNLDWSENVSGEFRVPMRVIVEHRRGVLATIAATIADNEANIEHVDTRERDNHYHTIDMVISVHNRHHLSVILRKLRVLSMVVKINRV